MDGDVAFVSTSQPMDVDTPLQSAAQSSPPGMASTDQYASNMRQVDRPPGLSLSNALALEPPNVQGPSPVVYRISTPTASNTSNDNIVSTNVDLQPQDVMHQCRVTIQEAQLTLQADTGASRDPTIDDPISATGQDHVEQSLTNLRLVSDSSPECLRHDNTDRLGLDNATVDDLQAMSDVCPTPAYPVFGGELPANEPGRDRNTTSVPPIDLEPTPPECPWDSNTCPDNSDNIGEWSKPKLRQWHAYPDMSLIKVVTKYTDDDCRLFLSTRSPDQQVWLFLFNIYESTPWRDMQALIAERVPGQTMQLWVPTSSMPSEAIALEEFCHLGRLYLSVDSHAADRTIDSLRYCTLWLNDATLYKTIIIPFHEFPVIKDTRKIVFKTRATDLDESSIHEILVDNGIDVLAITMQPFRDPRLNATERGVIYLKSISGNHQALQKISEITHARWDNNRLFSVSRWATRAIDTKRDSDAAEPWRFFRDVIWCKSFSTAVQLAIVRINPRRYIPMSN